MLIYIVLLSAVAVITYLVQILAYSFSRSTALGSDLLEIIGLPLDDEFEFEQAVENI